MTFEHFTKFVKALSEYQTLVITDIDGVINWIDDNFEYTTGYSKNEVIGKKISLIRSPFTDKSIFENMYQVLFENNPWKGDFINQKKDGTFFRVEVIIFPFHKNKNVFSFGAVWKYRSSLICNAEKSLKLKDEKGFYVIHQKGKIFTVNSTHPLIKFSSSHDTFTLNLFVQSIVESEGATDKNKCSKALLEGECFLDELNIAVDCPGLSELMYFTIYCGHYAKCIIYYLKDVTEVKKQELIDMHQRRLASAGEMLATIAHQWKQPLNVIRANIIDTQLESMLGEYSEQNCLKKMKDIDKQVVFLSNTINTFTEFLNFNIKNEPFSMLEIVKHAVEIIRLNLKKNSINVEIDIDDASIVTGPKEEMIHIILNLLTNSIDAFQEREVPAPLISIKNYVLEGESIIEIQDNAGGIDKSMIYKIFDPYFSTKSSKQGTGIGLYIVRNTIEKHFNGTISVKNINGGALFAIRLPILQ